MIWELKGQLRTQQLLKILHFFASLTDERSQNASEKGKDG